MLYRNIMLGLIGCITLTTGTGCNSLSRFAYSCGDFLSAGPQGARCADGPTTLAGQPSNCQISGAPCAQGPVATSGYSAPSAVANGPNGGVAPASFNAAESSVEANVRDLQQQTAKLRSEVMDVKRHLTLSQSELIETRAANELNRKQLDRMQSEIAQWGQQLANLQSQIQVRDDERMRQMREMDRAMQQLLVQYEEVDDPNSAR